MLGTTEEVGSLVVNMMGDNSSYVLMLQDSIQQTKQASTEFEKFQDVLNGKLGNGNATGILGPIKTALHTVLSVVPLIASSFTGVGAAIVTGLGASLILVGGLFGTILSAAGALLSGITKIITSVISVLWSLVEVAIKVAYEIISAVANAVTTVMSNLLSALSGIASKILLITGGIVAAVAGAFEALGAYAIKLAADFETTRIRFEVFLGSAEKANKLLAELQELARTTPLEMGSLQQATSTLLGYGVAEEKVLKILRALGDVSGGNRERFEGLALAYAQAAAAGRLMGQDLLQMVNHGFNPLQIISQKTGKTLKELREMMHEGGISAAVLEQAFLDATSEGGKFFHMLEKQAETTMGLFSIVKDTLRIYLKDIGESLIRELDIKNKIKSVIAFLDAYGETIKKNFVLIISSISKVFIQIGSVLFSLFETIRKEYLDTTSFLRRASDTILGFMLNLSENLTNLWKWLVNNWRAGIEDFKNLSLRLWEFLRHGFFVFGEVIVEVFTLIFDYIVEKGKSFGKSLMESIKGEIVSGLRDILKIVTDLSGLGGILGKHFSLGPEAQNFLKENEKIIQGVGKALENMRNKGKDAGDTLLDNLFKALEKGKNKLGNPFEGFISGMDKLPEMNLTIQKDGILDWIKGLISQVSPEVQEIGKKLGYDLTGGASKEIEKLKALSVNSLEAADAVVEHRSKFVSLIDKGKETQPDTKLKDSQNLVEIKNGINILVGIGQTAKAVGQVSGLLPANLGGAL